MRSFLVLVLCLVFFRIGIAQTPGASPETAPVNPSGAPAEAPVAPPNGEVVPPEAFPPGMTEELNNANGIVLKKNNFNYDSTEGRDPFKIYREIPLFAPGDNPGGIKNGPVVIEKSIKTAVVPGDIVLQGILYKKVDPIALVRVRDVKGLHKLQINSPVGRNEGKVIEIHKDKVVIEQVRDFDGQKFTEKVTLKVREKKK